MSSIDHIPVVERTCVHCNVAINESARYCSNCGQSQDVSYRSERPQGPLVTTLVLFFLIELIIFLVWTFNDEFHGLKSLLFVDALSTAITIVCVVITWKHLKPIMQWKSFSLTKLAIYIGLAIVAAFVVNVMVNWFNRTILGEEFVIHEAFSHLRYGKLITILIVAVQPALIEEFGYRGVMQTGLSKLIDPKQALYLASFLFAILHLNFISLFWLIPFAIFLGTVRNRENTIWYSIVIHFVFNSTACVFEFFNLL